MWVVRFIRKDGKPDEEYFYPTFSDAEYHMGTICRFYFYQLQGGLFYENEHWRKENPVCLWLPQP